MKTTEAILNYAALRKGTFQRKELLRDIVGGQTGIKERAIDLQIKRFVASGTLLREARGEYRLAGDNLPEFVCVPSESEKNIFLKLKDKFPLLEMCVWSPRVLANFMLHVPDIGYTLIDVEKDGMEPVFNALQSMNIGRNILFAPSPKDCERYLTGSDAVVVRQLVRQSPLTFVNGCTVPRIEKILVDAIGDNELQFASGSEIYNIYEYARERNNVNMSKLMRYASRRNRQDMVEQIINANNYDRSSQPHS